MTRKILRLISRTLQTSGDQRVQEKVPLLNLPLLGEKEENNQKTCAAPLLCFCLFVCVVVVVWVCVLLLLLLLLLLLQVVIIPLVFSKRNPQASLRPPIDSQNLPNLERSVGFGSSLNQHHPKVHLRCFEATSFLMQKKNSQNFSWSSISWRTSSNSCLSRTASRLPKGLAKLQLILFLQAGALLCLAWLSPSSYDHTTQWWGLQSSVLPQ